jgi:protein TonB
MRNVLPLVIGQLLLGVFLLGTALSPAKAELAVGAAEPGRDESGFSTMLAGIRKRIERARFYPDQARLQGIEGVVEVEFTLSADGRVKEVKVLRSSGSPLLDEASVETIKRAAPYPVVEDWPKILRIQLSITYRLGE